MECYGPGVQKNCLDIEDDEHQGKHVVADIELDPGAADRVNAGLVGGDSLWAAALGAEQLGGTKGDRWH